MSIFYFSVSQIEVLAGNIDRKAKENWIRASVSAVFVHEDYLPYDPKNSKSPYNDIAVLQVSKYIFRMNNT
jgi:hypothetical protein